VILVHCQECWLVPDVGDVLIVEVVEAFNESGWSSERGHESCLVMRDEANSWN
jgi:hypothetical protein